MCKRLPLSLSILLSLLTAVPHAKAEIKVTGRTARGNVLAAVEPADDSKGVRVLIELDVRPHDLTATKARAADLDRDLRQIDMVVAPEGRSRAVRH